MGKLQSAYVSENVHAVAYGRKALSSLRGSFGTRCGGVLDAAEYSLKGMPGRRSEGSPSVLEEANWCAFGLFAIHQRGLHEPDQRMQVDGVRFRDAVAAIRSADDSVPALVRRLAVSRTVYEAARACRPLIDLMRVNEVPCDHALLALMLRDFGFDSRREGISASLSQTITTL